MKPELHEAIVALVGAPSVCKEAKAAGEKALKAAGTKEETPALKALKKECQEDITTIADLVAFAHSDYAKKEFGPGYEGFKKHCEDLKLSGAKQCDCPACEAASKIVALVK
jgi:gas vesicle protein